MTLIEVLIVVVIIGILPSWPCPPIRKWCKEVAHGCTQRAAVSPAMEKYRGDNQSYATSAAAWDQHPPDGYYTIAVDASQPMPLPLS